MKLLVKILTAVFIFCISASSFAQFDIGEKQITGALNLLKFNIF